MSRIISIVLGIIQIIYGFYMLYKFGAIGFFVYLGIIALIELTVRSFWE